MTSFETIPLNLREILSTDIEICEVSMDEIPLTAKESLKTRLRWCQKRDDNAGRNFETIFEVKNTNDEIQNYAGHFIFNPTASGALSERIELIDIARKTFLGYGAAWLTIDEARVFKNQPYVAYTETEIPYRHKKLGLRRIQLLNSLCQYVWKYPLRSSNAISTKALSVWERLHDQGFVEIWDKKNEDILYRFKERERE